MACDRAAAAEATTTTTGRNARGDARQKFRSESLRLSYDFSYRFFKSRRHAEKYIEGEKERDGKNENEGIFYRDDADATP